MEIRLLLEKYKNLGFSEKRIKEITLRVCEEFSLVVASQDLIIKQTEIRMKISGSARTHFILIKKKLEERLQVEFKKENLKITQIS